MSMESHTKVVERTVAQRWLSDNGVDYLIEREGPMCFCAVGTYQHDGVLGQCNITVKAHGTNSSDVLDELVFAFINEDGFVGIPPIDRYSKDGLQLIAARLFDTTLHIAQAAEELGLDVFHRWVDMKEVEVALAQIGVRQCEACGVWTSTAEVAANDGICAQCMRAYRG